ncbi:MULTISPECIES: DNA repair protein RadA [unclassified Gemella]|uniref:DNA repair protein RadA n=1 Tax=unclassified Gemella TaxID=2624949 RepID=UPI0015CFDD1D|nr:MULTISPECIES: DNA repair protein RadA [unclassified Gemella]MBF0710632.1 DNA repair protein RadA [Gemella sp. GL1.1]NYS27976.1 DNA repair protein RadA [Gemella sp. GL1]
MAKKVTVKYECDACGYQSIKYLGKCPSCNKWASMEEIKEVTVNEKHKTFASGDSKSMAVQVEKLKNISKQDVPRVLTDSSELNRVLGGGIVPGSLILLGGDPGIGKSTLLLQISSYLAKEHDVLYVSGEESVRQVKIRADRMSVLTDELFVYSQTDLNMIYEVIQKIKPKFLVIDSIQTVYNPNLENSPGSITQVRESTQHLMKIAKSLNIAIFIVGHVTKEGTIAGPKMLEHMVDTVLYFEGEEHHAYRILRTVKNRFGSTNELGIFEMQSHGLVDMENPSEIFLEERSRDLSGATIVGTMEGTRPLLVEIQSLTTPTAFNNPRRISTGLEYNKLVLLMAVLEKKAGYLLQQQDIYVKVAGGVKIDDPAVDLGVLVSVASSFKDKAVDMHDCFIGEVGLTGEIRRVSRIEQRIKEAKKHGFTRVFIPFSNKKGLEKITGIEVIPVKDINKCLDLVFKDIF